MHDVELLNKYINIGNFNLSKTYTIDFWVYLTAHNTEDGESSTLVSCGRRGLCLDIHTRKLRILSEWTTDLAIDSAVFPLNTWVHIALVFDSNSLKVYKNGILTLSANSSFSNSGLIVMR